jgi:hypothetical protein
MLELAPGLGRQEPVLAAFRALDLEGCAQAFLKAAQGEFGGGAERAFRPFLERLHEFAAKARQARPVTLAELLDGPLGTLASLYARVDESGAGRRVRLVSYYFPARPDFSAEWYAGLAHRLEDQPLAGSAVRVTAARMVGLELKDSLIHDLEWISGVVGILVLVMTYVAVRSVSRALLAALPLAFSFLFVLAGVGLAERAGWNFSLNFVNLMIFPILLGSAIDYGIYMVMDVFSARRPALPQWVALTGRSVVLCALTTLGGFGSMIWGRNTGMISFGWAAILGYSGALFAALIVLPLLLGCLGVGTEAAAEAPQAPGAPVQAGRTDAPER